MNAFEDARFGVCGKQMETEGLEKGGCRGMFKRARLYV